MKKLQIVSKIGKTVSRVTGRTGLKIKKYSPEILIVGGVLGIVASTVLACKATLKLESVVDEAKGTVDRINNARATVDDVKYSDSDSNKDTYITYVQSGYKIAKLYMPAVTLGILSVSAILCSYKIMRGRNIALMAAYKGIEEAFLDYRKKLIADVGVDKDREYKYGMVGKQIDVVEDGKTVKKTVTTSNLEGSQYARFFAEDSVNWTKEPEYNMMFLKCQQQYANDLLNARGHVFLNEVYDMLGIDRSQAGSVVGWVKNNKDSYIDFNIFDGTSDAKIAFVNGWEKSILLDFNVDGVIYNMI